MVFQIDLLPRYLKNWGFGGLVIFLKVEIIGNSLVSIKGISHPFYLRKETSDRLVFHEVFLFKVYEIESKATKVIIDGGANIGLASIFFAEKFKDATIYSIEPSDSNFKILQQNTTPYKSIVTVKSALWNKDVHLKVRNKEEASWAISVEECEPDHPEAFRAISITSLMKEKGIEYIDILKLDIEGAERELFLDNYDYWIKRTKRILIELHDWLKKDASKNVFRTISNYNFSTVILNGMIQFTNTDLS